MAMGRIGKRAGMCLHRHPAQEEEESGLRLAGDGAIICML